jgi:hypothetical protein
MSQPERKPTTSPRDATATERQRRRRRRLRFALAEWHIETDVVAIDRLVAAGLLSEREAGSRRAVEAALSRLVATTLRLRAR